LPFLNGHDSTSDLDFLEKVPLCLVDTSLD
jgi:hypothetical protein